MCHSSKHTAGICIQDNETCHVNFILCLLALFVLSLFLALLHFVFPSFGNPDESCGHDGSSWTWVRCNIQIPFQCLTDKLLINVLCIIALLLFSFVQICSILLCFIPLGYIPAPPPLLMPLAELFPPTTYCCVPPAATADANSGSSFRSCCFLWELVSIMFAFCLLLLQE